MDLFSKVGYEGSLTQRIQDHLWELQASHRSMVGTGISAFPSLHVAIAFVASLYMIEKARWLILPAIFISATTLIGSVYTAYHYAIDGYFSIFVVFIIHKLLKRLPWFMYGEQERGTDLRR
jgi:membrane-associated phospholipid phosphatase